MQRFMLHEKKSSHRKWSLDPYLPSFLQIPHEVIYLASFLLWASEISVSWPQALWLGTSKPEATFF